MHRKVQNPQEVTFFYSKQPTLKFFKVNLVILLPTTLHMYLSNKPIQISLRTDRCNAILSSRIPINRNNTKTQSNNKNQKLSCLDPQNQLEELSLKRSLLRFREIAQSISFHSIQAVIFSEQQNQQKPALFFGQ